MLFDLLILLVLAIGGYFGYRKGFLIEIISILAFVIATMTAFKLLHTTINFFKNHFDSGSMAPAVAFITVFVGVFFLIFTLGKFLTNMLRYTLFGSVDKFAGAVVGVVKYAFAISVIFWLLHAAGLDKIYLAQTKGAIIYPYILEFARTFISWVSYIIPFTDVFESIKRVI